MPKLMENGCSLDQLAGWGSPDSVLKETVRVLIHHSNAPSPRGTQDEARNPSSHMLCAEAPRMPLPQKQASGSAVTHPNMGVIEFPRTRAGSLCCATRLRGEGPSTLAPTVTIMLLAQHLCLDQESTREG